MLTRADSIPPLTRDSSFDDRPEMKILITPVILIAAIATLILAISKSGASTPEAASPRKQMEVGENHQRPSPDLQGLHKGTDTRVTRTQESIDLGNAHATQDAKLLTSEKATATGAEGYLEKYGALNRAELQEKHEELGKQMGILHSAMVLQLVNQGHGEIVSEAEWSFGDEHHHDEIEGGYDTGEGIRYKVRVMRYDAPQLFEIRDEHNWLSDHITAYDGRSRTDTPDR